jgi:hypothetical protein
VGRRFRGGFNAEHAESAEGAEKKDRKGTRPVKAFGVQNAHLGKRPLQRQENGKKAA